MPSGLCSFQDTPAVSWRLYSPESLSLWVLHPDRLTDSRMHSTCIEINCNLYIRIPIHFYRAMHFSAFLRSWDRMSSVCPSVTLVICDHIGWKSWKLIAQTMSPAPSLFVAKGDPPTPRGTWGNFGETRGGVGKKWCAGEQKRQYLWNA